MEIKQVTLIEMLVAKHFTYDQSKNRNRRQRGEKVKQRCEERSVGRYWQGEDQGKGFPSEAECSTTILDVGAKRDQQ